ncbi:class I SAM-dependent methyltransferase [Fulvimarina sp. MAC3]|uniref:class I SAM-dependent methyltransferase n=1 Tax=Fulvimarina sp. MAC3 TaxID=3148887 RepID=UPI0031FCF8E4
MLSEKIAREIGERGPMTVERFWEIALFDRKDGYYSTHEPFGRAGDFTTAPEISQMFGELIGAWCASVWAALGRPSPFLLAEIGPGRGTLMADILRTLRRTAPDCLAASRIRLVETSERLAALQASRLEGFDLPIKRVRRIEELESMPMIVVANELFDAIAIRQAVLDKGAWRERRIDLSADGGFVFVLGDALARLPVWLSAIDTSRLEEGAIAEYSPARETLAAGLGQRLHTDGGAGLFIDYGHAISQVGDTFQALSEHRYVPVLDRPGEADLTSHVDFESLAHRFTEGGLMSSPIRTQGNFLLSMGLLERAGRLGAPLDETGRNQIRADVQRLAGNGPKDMGDLFKVMGVSSAPIDLPPFSASGGD